MRDIGLPATRRLDPWTADRPGPLEILGRLAGNTSFRLPQGGGKGSISNEDIQHALAKVRPLRSQLIALAVATGNRQPWSDVQRLAYPKLISELLADRRTRPLVSGANKFRARLVLHDAFHDMVAWRAASWREASQRCGMQQQGYKDLYHAVAGFLRTEAAGAAHTAICRLFAHE